MNEQRLEIVFASPLRILHEEAPQGRQCLTLAFDRFAVTAEGDHVMYTLPVDHAIKMQVSYFDAAGNPAVVDGAVRWQSSDQAIVTLDVDTSDTTICTAIPAGQLGQVQVSASADADLGSGVREVITTCDISIVAGEAVVGTISPVGEPVPIEPMK
jgi:hypothetical protein